MSYRDGTLLERLDMLVEEDFNLTDFLMKRVDEGKEAPEDEKIIRTLSLLQKRFQQAKSPEDLLALSGHISLGYAAYRTTDKNKKAHGYKLAKMLI